MSEIYPFEIEQESDSQAASYSFTTKLAINYSVSFTEVTRIIDIFDGFQTLSNGVYLVIEPVNPPEIIPFDANVGVTISSIFLHYLNNIDLNSIVIFNCEEKDGKQLKRHKKFNRWFLEHIQDIDLHKIDKELLIPENHPEKGIIYIPSFISIIFRPGHPRYENILNEIALATENINKGKPEITILD